MDYSYVTYVSVFTDRVDVICIYVVVVVYTAEESLKELLESDTIKAKEQSIL